MRDPDDWYESVRATIHATTGPDAEIRPVMRDLLRTMWEVEFGSWDAVPDRDHAIARFDAQNASVRADCPPDRLVEWRVGDG